MSEQNTSKAKNDNPPETAPQVAPPASGDRELSDDDLGKVAGGFAPAPARKAGKPQQEY